MGVDAATFRAALGQWPNGVTVVTTVVGGEWFGLTASSFSGVSLDPPLVSFSVARAAATHDRIAASGVFAVNILAKDQVELGKRFAGMVPGVADRFEGLQARTAKTGSPVLPGVLAWLDCEVRHAYAGGDHTIFVGEVLAAEATRTAPPLLYHSRVWGQFADVLPEVVSLTGPDPSATPVAITATPAESALAGDGPVVLVDDGTATPLQVRGSAAQLLLLARPRPVSVRLARGNPFAQANLLTALKSGVSVIEVGDDTLDETSVQQLLAALDISTGDPA